MRLEPVSRFLRLSPLHRFGPVLSVFDLLHYNDPIPLIHECVRILLPVLLGEPHVQLFRIRLHPVEVKDAVANHGIFIEELVKLAQFKEDNAVVALALDFPILSHGGGEIVPLFIRDKKGGGVIFGVRRPATVGIHDVFVSDKPGFPLKQLLFTHLIRCHTFIAILRWRDFASLLRLLFLRFRLKIVGELLFIRVKIPQ